MKKHSIYMALAAVLFALCSLPSQAQTGQIRGKVVGQDGQPVAGAQVVYSDTSNGRTYKYKTDKKGEFSAIGVQYSNTYEVTVTSPSGEQLFHHKGIAVGGDPEQNILNVDLAKNAPHATGQESAATSDTGGNTEQQKPTKDHQEQQDTG